MTVNGPLCGGCAFEQLGTIFIPHDGTGSNGIMLIGDSGWEREAAALRDHLPLEGLPAAPPYPGPIGTPFSGPSGYYIERNLARIQAARSDFTITNAMWCKAPRLGMTDNPGRFPAAAAALAHCRPYLDALIAARKPKVLIPLGGAALKRVTGLSNIERHHAYVLDTSYGIPAIPAFHPSYIMKGNQKLSGCFLFVLNKARAIARGAIAAHRDYTLLADPPLAECQAYFPPTLDTLFCDIETAHSPGLSEDEAAEADWRIVRVSFSVAKGTAISMPWAPPYIGLAKEVLARAVSVVFWNQSFDVPRLWAAGCPIPGRIIDAMWAWHFLQSDLPKALGFAAPLLVNVAPWKHLSATLPARYSALDSAITNDCYISICRQLSKEGRLDAFHRQCTDLLPVLRGISDAGMLIDRTQQSKFLGELVVERDQLFATIQRAVPSAIKPAQVFKRYAPKKLKAFEQFIPATKGGTLIKAFNPGSHKQLKDLLRALKIAVPCNWRTGKESIASKQLERYARRFPVLKDIKAYNERQKLITGYAWSLGDDARIHPEYGFNPSTWRKSAANPNVQTIPKRGPLAKRFREMFIAAPDCLLVEADSSAIEAVLVGFFADSPEYIALAKRGVHKWLAEQVAGRPVSKDEPLYDKAKRIVHLSNYMGTPKRIAEEYPDDFKSVAEARELQDFYFGCPAGQAVRRWQSAVIAQAHHDHYLETPFGQRHYFFDVLAYRDGQMKLSDDAKRAVAFKPQATASALQTLFIERLLRSCQTALRAIVHDSLIFEVAKRDVLGLVEVAHEVMTQPIAELSGLTIGAEVKIGPNLAHMEVWEQK